MLILGEKKLWNFLEEKSKNGELIRGRSDQDAEFFKSKIISQQKLGKPLKKSQNSPNIVQIE